MSKKMVRSSYIFILSIAILSLLFPQEDAFSQEATATSEPLVETLTPTPTEQPTKQGEQPPTETATALPSETPTENPTLTATQEEKSPTETVTSLPSNTPTAVPTLTETQAEEEEPVIEGAAARAQGLFVQSRGDNQLDQMDMYNPAIIRSRFVEVRFDLLGDLRDRDVDHDVAITETIELNLFDDAVYTAELDRVDGDMVSGYVWVGHIPGEWGSTVTLAVHESGIMSGTIITIGGVYEIRLHQSGGHVIHQIDQSVYREAEPQNDFDGGSGEQDTADAVADSDETGDTIDVLVVYTDGARRYEGGTAAMHALIDNAISTSNTTYGNSGITQRLRLVHRAEVYYTETGSMGTDLNRLENSSDGHMDDVHTWRDIYSADTVLLITKRA